MKRFYLLACMFLSLLMSAQAQHPNISIRQMQQVPLDSLLLADQLQNTVPSRWTLQVSPYYQDTVTVTAICIAPAKTITFTQRGWTLLLADTGPSPFPWGAVLVRVGAAADTSQAILDGFANVERGDIIRITGRIDEFPASNMNSVTQFVPISGVPIEIIGSGVVPNYEDHIIPDFYQGLFPGGVVKYSTGEPLEGVLVNLLTPLTVDARVNTTRGTFSMVDDQGNQLSDYDGSKYFTLKGSSIDHPAADSIWTIIYPNSGTVLDKMRGFITTVSGSESPRGYRISPLYRAPFGENDVIIGIILPSITTHRRNPITVPPDSSPLITARVTRRSGGYPIGQINLNYSIANGPFTTAAMSFNPTDSTYGAQIPNQPANTFVHYFIQAVDSAGNRANLASSAFGGSSSDTSKGFFFYTVLDRPLTIHDIQYTPYVNGRTAYLAAPATISGVITADTAHIGISPLNTGGTNAWYMQTGNGPWNGIWFVGTDTTLAGLRNGDSVSVSGFVSENFDVTQVFGSTSVVVHSTGNVEPAPVALPTSTFGPTVGNGNPLAEQYEGMLVTFTNVRVSSIDPVFSDPTEFEVDDGSGPIIVRRDGTHSFSNVAADSAFGKTILKVGDRISSLTGVIYFSFNRYKITPRRNSDFGTVTSVDIARDPVVPEEYALAQNYPNPFNPSTVIEYNLPRSGVVTLKLFNILGQEVQTLISGEQEAGRYTVRFDGGGFSTGVYFYRLQAADFTQVKKMMLVK